MKRNQAVLWLAVCQVWWTTNLVLPQCNAPLRLESPLREYNQPKGGLHEQSAAQVFRRVQSQGGAGSVERSQQQRGRRSPARTAEQVDLKVVGRGSPDPAT